MQTAEVITVSKNEELSNGGLRFNDYLLENVYLRTTETQRSEILRLWRDGGVVINGGQAERRSREVVFLVRAASGELAGVSEAALVRVQSRRRFYAYTMFLRASDRVPYLMLAVLNGTRDFLRKFAHPTLKPEGMVLVTENRKLMRPGVRKLLARHGYQYWGKTVWGDDVWAVEFGDSEGPPRKRFGYATFGVPLRASATYGRAPCGSELLDSIPRT